MSPGEWTGCESSETRNGGAEGERTVEGSSSSKWIACVFQSSPYQMFSFSLRFILSALFITPISTTKLRLVYFVVREVISYLYLFQLESKLLDHKVWVHSYTLH